MSEEVFAQEKQKKLFLTCVIASVGIHCLALLALYMQPLLLSSPLRFLFRSSFSRPIPYSTERLSFEEKNSYLADAFSHIVVSPHGEQGMDQSFLEQGQAFPTQEEFASESPKPAQELPGFVNKPLVFEARKGELVTEAPESVGRLLHEKTELEMGKAELQEEALLTNFVDAVAIQTVFFDQVDDTAEFLAFSNGEGAKAEPTKEFLFETQALPSIDAIPAVILATSIQEKATDLARPLVTHAAEPLSLQILPKTVALESVPPNFEYYSLSDAPRGRSWDKCFNVDVHAFADKEHHRYVFFLTLQPIKGLVEEKLDQNFYFLIDKSNWMEKHKFALYKKAVLRSLASLQEGDKFNIVVFDQKVKKFKEKTASFNKGTLVEAEKFLNAQEVSTAFSGSDLYGSLEKIFSEPLSSQEVHTAVLLSDGSSISKPHKQQKAITNWLKKNQGKVSLYTVAIGNEKSSMMLELLSSLTKGKHLHSDTFSAFPRKLAKLVLDLRNPLVKDIEISSIAASTDKDVEIHFFPSFSKRPTVYFENPYMIAGTIDECKDFTILLQAKHGEELINLEKTISFSKAKQATPVHRQLWANIHAQKCFELFLESGDTEYLEKAKKFLAK